MGLASFVRELFEHGRVHVSDHRPGQDDLQALDEELAGEEERLRFELPGIAPRFDLPVARWAAMHLYQACWAVIDRTRDPKQTAKELLALPCPDAPPASRHYSVDLTFRFLPDLLKQAEAAEAADPLVDQIKRLAAGWPLSSVGMLTVESSGLGPWIDDPCLLRLYLDRIIQRRDFERLQHPRVRDAALIALGDIPQLDQPLADTLASRKE